ncbi:RNA polymerase sigma-70 factor [Streptomyces sp. NPDC013178]|uniref:RNA polymerase sigma-70 factor n=1 Tax=Streptomyces sp. NPDC013178 TaxID=3155118 RepID=UPI0033C73CEF
MTNPHRPNEESLDQAAEEFLRHRPRMFGIAYRILGSVAEAEEVVQDAWLRWQRTDRTAVLDPGHFLSTVATHLAINVAQSARVRREAYVGTWLPEPVDTEVDPAVGAERGEALELAVLMMMEKLKPVERAVYVLREAFDYPYEEIAALLQLNVDNVRQIASRARKRLSAERRAEVDKSAHRRLLDAFVAAAQTGDVRTLEKMLSEDAVSYADGNGVRGVAQIPVTGVARISKISAFVRKFVPGAEFRPVEANGRPAMLIVQGQAVRALLTITTEHNRINGVYWVVAPEKLEAFLRSGDRIRRLV